MENEIKEDKKVRNEKEGILNFGKEMISALLTAFIFIVYVIQAFTIPTGSMEKSLLVGDFLLGLKFIYGAPVLPNVPFVWENYLKFPGFTSPKRGDVVIFKYPGGEKKDYIKRCVAVAGDSVEIDVKRLIINDKELTPPPFARWENGGNLRQGIRDFSKLYIPKKGDTLNIANAEIREFIFYKHLIHQEHPRSKVSEKYQLFVDGVDFSDSIILLNINGRIVQGTFSTTDFDRLAMYSDWTFYLNHFDLYLNQFDDDAKVEIEKKLFLDGQEISKYVCKNDNYFMMGDNRDNSADSRYWGFVNRNFVKAKAFIIYFSLDEKVPAYLLPVKIRWNRLGKLIRNHDGGAE
ncbi:MAG: signal peptidase I [Chitinivibrionia bacterium]|nr:signal peptidase I [Chitinivibrionia bacterium]